MKKTILFGFLVLHGVCALSSHKTEDGLKVVAHVTVSDEFAKAIGHQQIDVDITQILRKCEKTSSPEDCLKNCSKDLKTFSIYRMIRDGQELIDDIVPLMGHIRQFDLAEEYLPLIEQGRQLSEELVNKHYDLINDLYNASLKEYKVADFTDMVALSLARVRARLCMREQNKRYLKSVSLQWYLDSVAQHLDALKYVADGQGGCWETKEKYPRN